MTRFHKISECSTGLIVPLGGIVLAAACSQAAQWQKTKHPLGVAVNVSSRQLSCPRFVDSINRVLRVTGLSPHRLTIEVTESVWADEAAMRSLMAVRDTGARVALDDFGTDYSSLSYLQRYPFDLIKIDRSFTSALFDARRTSGVVTCIIELASTLGAQTIAEGVETLEQAEWLLKAGCTSAQGYLFGKPDDPRNWIHQPAAHGRLR